MLAVISRKQRCSHVGFEDRVETGNLWDRRGPEAEPLWESDIQNLKLTNTLFKQCRTLIKITHLIGLCPIHTADADATQLDSCVAPASALMRSRTWMLVNLVVYHHHHQFDMEELMRQLEKKRLMILRRWWPDLLYVIEYSSFFDLRATGLKVPRDMGNNNSSRNSHMNVTNSVIIIGGRHKKKLKYAVWVLIWARYCKTLNFRMPFISRISRPRQIRENNRSQIYLNGNLA